MIKEVDVCHQCPIPINLSSSLNPFKVKRTVAKTNTEAKKVTSKAKRR